MGTGRVIVSVKGGTNIGPDMIGALAGTVQREGAELGILVLLSEPSPRMRQEAAALGIRKTAQGSYPKIQIVTIDELLSRKKLNLPRPYDVELDERVIQKDRRKMTPQLAFTFAIRGGKDSIVYPAERLVAQRVMAG